jgi:lipopolysaccharide export system permease protein
VLTFDRYLLSRYFHIFVVFFIAAMGLYVVADGFTNLDDFQHSAGEQGTRKLLALMAEHYLYRSSLVFELAGPTLAVMSAMCALALSLKHGEIHPLLAAGVPLYRLSLPFVFGVLCINGALTANQEWVLPRIAPHLQVAHGQSAGDAQGIEPAWDSQMTMFVTGQELFLNRRTIRQAEFRLCDPLVQEQITVRAEEATWVPENRTRAAGWLLQRVSPVFEQLKVTEAGRRIVLPQQSPDCIFIGTDLSFDQLSNRSTSYRLLPTQQLIWRVRRPSAGLSVRRAQLMCLHERLTRPVVTLIGVFLVMPLIARRERMSLVTNVAVCMGTVGVVYAAVQGMLMLGSTGWLRPELCTWLPLSAGGVLCAWLSPLART